MSAWLLWVALALADPVGETLPVPVDPALQQIWERGQQFERAGDPASAVVAYRIVVRGDPRWTPGLLALGHALESSDRLQDALEVYSRSAVPDVLLERARVELELERPDAAARTLARLRRADPSAEVVRLQALADTAIEPGRGAERLREWLGWQSDRPEDDAPQSTPQARVATVLTVVDALVEGDRVEEATLLLSDAVEALPELLDDETVSERLDDLLLDAEARQWMRSGAVALDSVQTDALDAVERALRRGDVTTAREGIDALVVAAPRSARVWSTRARVALMQSDVYAADDALQRAEFLAPSDPNYAAAMGDLLATRYGGREDAAAVEAYRRALRRDPLWSELWWRLARIEQRSGLGDRGVEAFERYIALEPEGEHADEARRRLADLARERPAQPPLPDEPEPPPGVSYEALLAYHRVGVLRARGEREAALDEVRRVRALAPGFADAVNLEASLFLDEGDRAHAIAAYTQSLELEPDQPGVVLTLWELLQREGRTQEAAELVDSARDNGIGDVHFLLARSAARQGQRAEALSQLDHYASSQHTDRFIDDAAALRTALLSQRRRVRIAIAAVGTVVFGLMGMAIVVRWWRGRGLSLDEVVDRHPELARPIAQTVAAVRHEVLKHDTTVLFDVASALDDGDPDPAIWASSRLFGPRGTVERFREQLATLRALAGQAGERLDLERVDPVFAPMVGAMRRLEHLRRDLERGRARAAPELRAIAVALNEDGFDAVGNLVHSLSVMRVDEGFVRQVVERVETEFGVRGVGAFHIHHCGDDVRVRAFRGELEDVLTNLVRNAHMAAPDAPVLVRVDVDVDPITFREDVRIAVCDNAPGTLTDADIRLRPAERGLGIARTLAERSDGTLSVQPVQGWAKAVVLTLPTVESREMGCAYS